MKVFRFYVTLVNFPVLGETGWNGSWPLEKFPDKESLFRDSDIQFSIDEFSDNMAFNGEGLTVSDEFTGEEFIDLEFHGDDDYPDPYNQVECDYRIRVINAYVLDGLNWQIDYVEEADLHLTVAGDNIEQAKQKCEELAKKFFLLNEKAIMEVNFMGAF